MIDRVFGPVLRHLYGLAGRSPRPAGTDADLVQAFADNRDEAAFAELVRRHGPLVWGICRRLLNGEADAEDAFQATFLVLTRRAGSISRRESVASWLYGVARRTALCARARADRRRDRPPEGPVMALPDPAAVAASAEECGAILDELHRLPKKYRAVLVLCGLEGLTRTEAARLLGWKEGTVAGRLARARRFLEGRLARRGIVLPMVLPIVAIAVPGPVNTAAYAAAVGEAVPSATVSAIAQEVAHAMTVSHWKPITAVAVAALLAAGGAARFLTTHPASDNPPTLELPAGAPHWQERVRLRGYAGSDYSRFSPDGKLLVTVDSGNILHFWDTATWQKRGRYDLGARYGEHYTIETPFAPDGRLIAISGKVPVPGQKDRLTSEVTLIEVPSGRERARVPGGQPYFSPAGHLLATPRDDAVTLWDTATGKEVRTLTVGSPVKSWGALSFSRDGALLAVTAINGGRLWEVTTGHERGRLTGFLPVFAPDGHTLATVLPGPAVKLYDPATGREQATLTGFGRPGAYVQFSPDGRLLLTNTSEYGLKANGDTDFSMPRRGRPKREPLDVRLWGTATGQELARLPGNIRLCRSGQFSPDGKLIAYLRLAGSSDQMEVVLWDVAERKELRTIRHPNGIEGVSFTLDGTMLIGTTGASKAKAPNEPTPGRLWDVATGRPLPTVPGLEGMTALDFSPDGRTMVVGVLLPNGRIGAPTPMEIRVFQFSAEPVVRTTIGEPAPSAAPPPAPKPSPAVPPMDALRQECAAADAGFASRFQAAKSDADRQQIQQERLAALGPFVARALDLARRQPRSDVAAKALEFALRTTSGSEGQLGEQGAEAVLLARQQFLSSAKLDRLLPWLATHHSLSAEQLLRDAWEKSLVRAVRGRAGFHLAQCLAERAEAARLLRQMPDLANRPDVRSRPEIIRRLRATDSDAADHQAEALYEQVRQRFADVPLTDGQSGNLGPAAERALFALRHLAIGKEAPDIIGPDLDGKPMKLSDYRGRVVVLIFCGNWCGPCRAMDPHKRALVKRLADQPFALLEVNSDDNRDEVRERMKEDGDTWRSWFDGGREGPIHRQWNVTRWPTVYVLDARGVIRYKELRDEPLEQAVIGLMKEMKR